MASAAPAVVRGFGSLLGFEPLGLGSSAGTHQLTAASVTVLAIVVAILFWRFVGSGVTRSTAELEYWSHRRGRAVASISELLRAKGRRPAKKVFRAMFDEYEEVLVTQEPLAVPLESAHLREMTELLRQSLGPELREAVKRGDVGEVEELHHLGQHACRYIESALCSDEMREAAAFLQTQGTKRRQQIWRLLRFCDREVLQWLSLGLVIKIASQVPGPVRMLYVSATVTAAARGAEGAEEFHASVLMCIWLFLAEKLLQFAGRITMFRGEQLFTLRLKKEVYAACLRQDMEFFDAHQCGELQVRLYTDTQEICHKLLYFPVRFVQFTFFLIFNIMALISSNPQLVLATLSALPVSLFGNLVLMRRLGRFYERMQRRAEVSASKTAEVLSNIRTVRSFAREPWELEKYMNDQEYETRVLNQVNLLQGMTTPVLQGISEMSFFAGLYYGGLLITQGLLSSAEVITLVQGTQACTGVLMDLFDTLPEIAKAGKPAARICDLLERPTHIECELTSDARAGDSPTNGDLRKHEGCVEFQDVHFTYATRREAQVLRGLSFVARAGEVVALVGATGCGKSTVVNLLLRFYSPDRGRVLLDGRPLDEYNVHWLRRQVGVVAQEPLLFGTSIRENLLYGVDPSAGGAHGEGSVVDAELQRFCELANAWEFIRHLPEGLATEVGERGVQLSGGQKQRIAIARAILKRPKVLLLDEATSAMDVESEQVVQRALDEVIRATACTTLVIAHRLVTTQNASKIVVISEGVVHEEGPPDELAARPGGLFARQRMVDSGGQRHTVATASVMAQAAEEGSVNAPNTEVGDQ